MERKLTAILCADVYGYSRLMGEDEEATHRTLISHRRIIDGLIHQHHGRFVNSAGDSVLAEFASAVNAVECAVEMQTTLRRKTRRFRPAAGWSFALASTSATWWWRANRSTATGSMSRRAWRVSPSRAASTSPRASTSKSETSWRWAMRTSANST